MAPAQWRQVEEIFDSALELAPPRRSAFLDQACAGDLLLRREVAALLACADRADAFLEVPALEMAGSVPDRELDGEELLPAGAEIGPYRIVAALEAGGMGQVYRARDTRLERDVALKFPPAGMSTDAQALKRFQREARAASALNHPNICTLHDIGEHDGAPYLVMELIEGQSLKQRLAAGPPPLGEVLELAVQISDALQAAHSRGIIHRDIKPGNLFVTLRGQAMILDFGLSKLLAEPAPPPEADPGDVGLVPSSEESISRAGAVLGTAAYISPEQARGEEVDARGDLFSFGVTLYQMMTGTLPFQGDTPELVVEAILTRQPLRPRERNPAIPPELERIVLKTLEKDRTARYQTAAELRADLERLRPAPRAARWPLAVAAALLLALVGTAIGIRHGWFGAQPQTAELTPRQVTANPAEDPVVRVGISADGQYLAYTDLTGIHVRHIDTGETRSIPPEEGFCFR